jgi:putative transposase
MRRAFKYRWYPTSEQAALLARTFGCIRYVWNRALAQRTDAWRQRQQHTSYQDASAWLTQWKRDADTGWLNKVSSVPLQQTLRHQHTALGRFFAKRARYPRFKSKRRSKASAEFTRSAFRWRDGKLYVAKLGEPLDSRWSRPLPDGAEPSTVTVSRDRAGRWFVSISVEDPTLPDALPRSDSAVGIDVGLNHLAVLSTGEAVTNPRQEQRDRQRLARAQRNLSRTHKGSNNRHKAARKVARIHARIADRRRDHLHKLSTRLIRENQTVVVEDLNVHGMVANHSLARSISDSAWGELVRQLEYKAAWYGRTLVKVDRWYPSTKQCSNCGWILADLALSQRTWTCPQCGVAHDRDVNAALNVLAAGLAVTACGDGVRPANTGAAVSETGTSTREGRESPSSRRGEVKRP